MEIKHILKANSGLFGIIIIAALARLIPHPANFAPIAGLALFSGAHFKNRFSFLIPLSAMLFSDLIIGSHSTMVYVYSSFFLIFLIGRLIKEKKHMSNLLIASLTSSVLFFLITNFGSWLTSSMYEKSLNGLIKAYILGLPFFRNTVLGDITYTLVFFYGYEYFFVIYKKIYLAIKKI